MTIIPDEKEQVLDQAVAEGGAYEVMRKRLNQQTTALEAKVNDLNEARLAEFGRSELALEGRIRTRTENNCIPRDIVRVGDSLLFGYNVFIGLKKETQVADVFALYRLHEATDGADIEPLTLTGSFLDAPSFVNDFRELYSYYKHARLIQLHITHDKLLAAFQIGQKITDLRVFRWSIALDGSVSYIDNRGERDLTFPPSHDFEWTATRREDHIGGKHPHISILDKVFVETVNGDLTIKVENNTEDGQGIYSEPVEDITQGLADAEIHYAKLGTLILLKIKPYREKNWRYLLFDMNAKTAVRIDAIGEACAQLPEDHGIIFPGGYYLQNGDHKIFGDEMVGMTLNRIIRSPNGEDVLYIFYESEHGKYAFFSYNIIQKSLQNPIYANGYLLFPDGRALFFSADSPEPTRIHAMQIWLTPFMTEEHAANVPQSQTLLGRIGNADLVRGISELYSVTRSLNISPSKRIYSDIIATSTKLFDRYFWLDNAELGLAPIVREISASAKLVLDEFEKVESIRNQSESALRGAESAYQTLVRDLELMQWRSPEQFVEILSKIRQQRGQLATIKELRYIDTARIEAIDASLIHSQTGVSEKAVEFLNRADALQPYFDKIEQLRQGCETADTATALDKHLADTESLGQGLDLLTEMLNTLQVGDATIRARILESISEVYGKANQTKAHARNRRKELGSVEAIAEFGAKFKLFSQSIANAISMTDSPERCDEQLARLLAQLEEFESQFGQYEQFLPDIINQREELYETFESRKQSLLDERQQRAQSLASAAERIIDGMNRRTQRFTQLEEINTYFASDAMVHKLREFSEQLRTLGDTVRADDVEAKVKVVKERAIRSIRDKTDIFEEGGNVVRMGKHRFSVNSQALDLTLLKKDDSLVLHLTGTEYFQPINNAELNQLSAYWEQSLISENRTVYRAEYLAYLMLCAAEQHQDGLSIGQLEQAVLSDGLMEIVRAFVAPRYQEGYERGIHDHDAAKILARLLSMRSNAELLRFTARQRAWAQLFWHSLNDVERKRLLSLRTDSAQQLYDCFASDEGFAPIRQELKTELLTFAEKHQFNFDEAEAGRIAIYLSLELAKPRQEFVMSQYAQQLSTGLLNYLDGAGRRTRYLDTLREHKGALQQQWALAEAWLHGYVKANQLEEIARFIPEAIALQVAEDLPRTTHNAELNATVSELIGDHPVISSRTLALQLDEFEARLAHYCDVVVPGYHRFLTLRQQVVECERNLLQLERFKASPLSTFTRNRLINEVYLPIVGDNLAKQIGSVGENRRTDLMGLLLLISPPGYGKTTLMEYVANRLGLIFMRINCPSLGHAVHSLDGSQAPNATARQELDKLNLALEMRNNVMLYLDDIQHTHPEFLQKFISLCDATRRIEGVWQGESKTYDMRGKKFCVVMAGNPYTESGEVFKIPDMLANRADIYNLGDVLSGREEAFALSYIENCLTSNPVLAPLALRDMEDVYKFIRMAHGEPVQSSELSHAYGNTEISEIVAVLAKLFKIQQVVLKVNQQYIASAAQADAYRTEPSFKLQGSYRNMSKMAAKVSAIMNDEELNALILDHYVGEAQTLTSGTEENLLKLAELQGTLNAEQAERWGQIKRDYQRIRQMGGDESDSATKVVNQLSHLSMQMSIIADTLKQDDGSSAQFGQLLTTLNGMKLELSRQPDMMAVIADTLKQDDGSSAQFGQLITSLDAMKIELARQPEVMTVIADTLKQDNGNSAQFAQLIAALDAIKIELVRQPEISVINPPPAESDVIIKALANTIEVTLLPVVSAMTHKLRLDHDIWDKVNELVAYLRKVEGRVAKVKEKKELGDL